MILERVSIYIISCERPKLLRRAIDSCIAQDYPNFEIIVVDDCSKTFDINSFENEYNLSNIIFFRLKERSGANIARNLALNKASGKYITGLDDDDYFDPKRISLMVSAYDKGDISFVASRFLFHSKRGLFSQVRNKLFELPFFTVDIPFEKMLNNNIVGNQILTETQFLRGVGGFDPKMPAFQDYDTWLRLIKDYGPGRKISKCLYYKEYTEDSITGKNKNKISGLDLIIQKHSGWFDKYPWCFELHRIMYEYGIVSFNQFLILFRKHNRLYLLKLLLRGKVRF